MSSEKIIKNSAFSQNPAYKTFVEAFLAALPAPDRAALVPAQAVAMLDELWAHARKRQAGTTLVASSVVAGAQKGWLHEKTRFFIISDDRPFIIDSITAEFARQSLTIETLYHPVLAVKRDGKGMLEHAAVRDKNAAPLESWLIMDVQGALPAAHCQMIERDLARVMDDVMLATRDWRAMAAQLQDVINELEHMPAATIKAAGAVFNEYKDFLKYLRDNNFTLLGYRAYYFETQKDKTKSSIVSGRSLGLLADERQPVFINTAAAPLPDDLQALRRESPILNVYKVNRRSTVHRRVPLDAITIKMIDSKGKVIGEHLFIGLFTSVTYSRSAADVPLLRYKVRTVIEQARYASDSHDYRGLVHILEKYPRDELFQMSVEQIQAYATRILLLQDRPRVALFVRVDPFRRYISCLVYVPRDRYETNLRLTLQRTLEKDLGGVCENFYTTLDDSPLARVMYVIRTDQRQKQNYDIEALQEKLINISRTWPERLRTAIMAQEHGDEKRAIELCMIYDTAFPLAYQDHFSPDDAVEDINKMEEAFAQNRIALQVYHSHKQHDDELTLKLYHPLRAAILSDVLPILENMGFQVLAEFPFEVLPYEGHRCVWVHKFTIRRNSHGPLDLKAIKPLLEDAVMASWYGQAENDPLNGLVISAGLTWREIVILRAYTKYMQQARVPYTPAYIMKALTDYPTIAAALVGFFHANHDPHLPEAQRNAKKWSDVIMASFEHVSSLDQDRILRLIKTLMDATLRTNAYQTQQDGTSKAVLSIKLDSQKISILPDPKPMVEIFVYSPRMEGIHLRGGRIARGGIRWSDRLEDFRTEILGLMQAQMVKNAVIVPVGAKGGFVLKKPPLDGGRDALQKEGIACYQMLVRGLLDVTDNLDGQKILPPKDVVRRDGDDPYLVVAADKGTATFSDIANALSAEYGFWLGDAFASGGSAGYDHKHMAITARGAWECIKRHFRELGHDIQTQNFTVVGVGDMAGDVFGNGMLLSKATQLIGAFNHMHIFCDPTPDPKTTWAERKRLFDEVKGWGDYNTKLLSKGGRIFLRTEKSLKLTPEIQKLFGLVSDEVTPAELIKAILAAPCDLLYFGGIGTYIKGSQQTHADAGDRANDALRLDAHEVRARVIGEGANLGITRKARVELSQAGIKLNADFIDNSGGVDCSDHEVNIKILLQSLTEGKNPTLTIKDRNILLKAMTDEVAELVLRDNYQQSQAISMAEIDAAAQLPAHARLIDYMERTGAIKRAVEGLPSQADIELRLREHRGLTRPELGTLISLSKMMVYKAILDSHLPDDILAESWLVSYFPTPIQKKYSAAIRSHRLRREIIATQMTASIVNRLGPSFMMIMSEKTGASFPEIATVCFVVREAFQLRPLWHAMEDLDGKVDATVQLKAMKQIVQLIEYVTHWFLKRGADQFEGRSLQKVSQLFHEGISTLYPQLEDLLPKARRARTKAIAAEALAAGFPPPLAQKLAYLGVMRSIPDIIRISGGALPVLPMYAQLFYHLGEDLHIDWLRSQARMLSGASQWQADAIEGVINQLYATQASLTRDISTQSGKKSDALERLHHWEAAHKQDLSQFEAMLSEMQRVPQLDLAMLTLAEQRLRQLGSV